MDSITFNAALCLGYLDKSDPLAQETMFMFLTHVERKKRFQVGKLHVNAEIEAAFYLLKGFLGYLRNILK